ncbi:unnamed protein product (macronuclear) [Paramecium tetraurelia]|uniref:Uncharacterized protein n=1 Tax=Paramecium tetraurelia TaxID=5888 RepID=A0DUU9_PARTE|nr:uncharacterized protein GSPATT00020478001 [Paramecium tetraurelia]CAK86816.1 unnamed protein product [Paramecium tetraurelia]|eukprot:XP_001454213.1 hypothetical protein (macronuclear) [Paramecium tetraurelia strain d4-2]
MKKFDNYDSFLKLTNRMSENSTPIGNIVQQKPHSHPTILNGMRNKNTQSYKTLCSPSRIFDYSDTPEIAQNQKNKYEASERKRQIEANTTRTINPSIEKCNSPQHSRIQSSTRYNVNQESTYKEPKRQVKACTQKSQDFNHRINLPISQMQVNDGNEEYGNSRTHKKSSSIQTFVNLQSSPIQNEFFSIYTDRTRGAQYEDSFRHLLTSYQKANQIKNEGKKKYPQSRLIYEQTKLAEQKVLKPHNKVFQQSENEQKVKYIKKGQGDWNLNQQKSNFKIY